MPRLRKQSRSQRGQSARESMRNNRARRDENDRVTERERNSFEHAISRQYRDVERVRDSSARARARARLNSEERDEERIRNSLGHAVARENSQYRDEERVRDTSARARARAHLNSEERDEERTRNSIGHAVARENLQYREEERVRDTLARAQARSQQNLVERDEERIRNSLGHAVARENSQYRDEERVRDTSARARARSQQNLVERDEERIRNSLGHAVARENSQYRDEERVRDTSARARARAHLNSEEMDEERTRNSIGHAVARENSQYRDEERVRDSLARANARAERNSEEREAERLRNASRRAQAREDVEYRAGERELDATRRSIRRLDPASSSREQERNTELRRQARMQGNINTQDLNRMSNCRVRIHRMDPYNRENENRRQSLRNRQNRRDLSPESRTQHLAIDAQRHSDRMLAEFNANVKKGPTEICICCGGLWFPNQVKQLNKDQFPNIPIAFFLSEIFPSETNIYTFCSNCFRIIKGNKVPAMCLHYGLHFPIIPDDLNSLSLLEERFVAPRIPFMRIVSLGYNRQCAVRGSVVNIPISVDKTVRVLPRTFDQTEVIQVCLKRKMEYTHNFMTETIRPALVYAAINYLINTELYIKHGITLSEEWFNNLGADEEVPFILSMEDRAIVNSLANEIIDIVEEFNPQETLLENNPIENVPIGRISLAPGEGQRPLDLIADEDSEELSFPSIYCGIKRTHNCTVGKLAKSEIRRFDRRCVRMDKLLYTYKKVEFSRMKDAISMCLRKKMGSVNYTARNMLDESFVNNLIQHDDGYHILKGIRSTPAHWEAEKKKVMAMVRQFGIPTFFITLSAAESQWGELLVILVKILENKDISEEEAMNYTTLEKYNLIRRDPVTCSRYFDQRIRHLFKHFKANGGIFDIHKVVKFYWRIEFQQRGSPHVHGIYWLENAPILNISDLSTFPAVVNFIDKYITTDSSIPGVENYISYQVHNHTRTCQRDIRGQKVCRFHIPYPPMPSTEILLPLPEDIDKVELDKHQENYNKIYNFLNAKLSDQEISLIETFDQFISHDRINLTYEDYIQAIISSLKKPRVFLKRAFKDKSVNAFNPNILAMQRANMDIQYVLDAYACVGYIVNYINKSHRGVSRLLQETMAEIKAGNFTIKQRLQHIGSKFISASEVSGQEASYNILGMHLSECSNAEVYINTLVPEKRVRMIKSRQELENLEPEATDIFRKGLLDHYIQRPDEMEDICLAYFAAYYKYSKLERRNVRRQQEDDEDNIEDEDNILDNQVGHANRLKDNSGYVYKKTNAAIIRFPSFNVDVARGEYFRSLVMLYIPWRNENEVLENDNEKRCTDKKDTIERNRLQFEVYKEGELEEILQKVQEENIEGAHILEDNASANQLLDDEFRALVVPEIDENINIFNINDSGQRNGDSEPSNEVRLIRLPSLISRDDLLRSVRTLNIKQREYLHHLLHNVVENIKFREFVGGGAGVGKSRLIKTIYQSVTTRFNSTPGTNPDLPKVLLSAPTGKAAFGIGGATLHALFSLPVNQSSGEIRPLSNDAVNSLLAKYIDVKLLIIDEISMVGVKMFGHLDSRLKQIFKSTEPFGGLSILVFGDLKQLPPVGDKWIFDSNSSNPYGVIVGGGLWHYFSFYELTEIMRQREDHRFAQALNAMAVGHMQCEDIQLIKSRVVQTSDVLPTDAIHLFSTNAEADNHNSLRLAQITTEEFISTAFDLIKSESLSRDERIRILNFVSTNMKTSETQGLCHKLQLKTTAKYMMTVNVDTNDGLVNGATGVLMEIELHGESRKPKTLWVLFSDESVGKEARRKKHHATESLWTPVELCVRNFQFKRNQQANIERKQFPMVVAEGITIHKSQGATYSKVVVHTKRRMIRAALYVACSRATSASGLFIIQDFFQPAPLRDTDPVKVELDRLRSTKALCLQNHFMSTPENEFKFFYQNIQSIEAHYDDIASDSTLMHSDIICLVETWSFPEEDYIFQDFRLLCRLNCYNCVNEERRRYKRGIMVYIKRSKFADAEYLFAIQRSHKIQEHTHVLQIIAFRYKDSFIIVLYRSPLFPESLLTNTLFEALHELRNHTAEMDKVIIIGDFNICRKTENYPKMERLLNERGFFSLLEKNAPTTKHGTHIDWAFLGAQSNHIISRIYKTIHSHHDGILLAMN